MGKYIKVFNNHNNYINHIMSGQAASPNVSYCMNENEVHYNPEIFANEYFTTIARENGAISFNIWQSMGTDMIKSISYSTNNGETWTTTNNTDNKEENLVITVNVNKNDKVMWKGNATQLGYYDEDEGGGVGSFFSSDCEFDAQGNVMSLLYGDDFKGETTIENEYAFAFLFQDYYNEKICKVVNAKNLSLTTTALKIGCYQYMFDGCTSLTTAPDLPATTLARGCYESMFSNCTSLTTAPELPATTLAVDCYRGMFYGCTSLTTAPALPAETLADSCYQEMFRGCTSLTTAPALPATTLNDSCYYSMFSDCTSLTTASELPATTLANECYNGMFQGCTSLTTAPELTATTLARGCYSFMFYGCTNLTTAPELPATTLANNCYYSMFNGCTSLTTAPALPATTLASSCYSNMFQGCRILTTAPELPATTLAGSCYSSMFSGCTSLNYIKAMFTTTPSGSSPNYYTYNWVNGVAASGTFVKNSAATWTTTGVHGVPTGWTVQNA